MANRIPKLFMLYGVYAPFAEWVNSRFLIWTPNEFANEIAASRDFIGFQTAENSPQSWYKKAGPIRRVTSLIRGGIKTQAGQ